MLRASSYLREEVIDIGSSGVETGYTIYISKCRDNVSVYQGSIALDFFQYLVTASSLDLWIDRCAMEAISRGENAC